MNDRFVERKINVTALCKVTSKGGSGTYLYIPHSFAEVYGLISGDRVEVHFKKLFKEKHNEETEEKPIDLLPRKGRLPRDKLTEER